jgi:hypothetical protein
MNTVEYENVGIEEFTNKKEGDSQRTKPVAVSEREGYAQERKSLAVPGGQARLGAHVACRAAEVLDFELAHGSMPA